MARKHSFKRILVSFRHGEVWEEWSLTFNRGNKQNKPVKFFAARMWRSPCGINPAVGMTFSALHFDCASEKVAEATFGDEIRDCKGVVVKRSAQLVRELKARFGYAPRILII
jgi:hypothetical protein